MKYEEKTFQNAMPNNQGIKAQTVLEINENHEIANKLKYNKTLLPKGNERNVLKMCSKFPIICRYHKRNANLSNKHIEFEYI